MKNLIDYYFERIFVYIPTQNLLAKSLLNLRAKEKIITILATRPALSKDDNKKISKLKKGLDSKRLNFLNSLAPKISFYSAFKRISETTENISFEQIKEATIDTRTEICSLKFKLTDWKSSLTEGSFLKRAK